LALSPEIEAFRRQFVEISAETDNLVGPLTEAQFSWQPAPGVWSVAECLEHLNASARYYLPALDEGIADAIRQGAYAEGPFAYNWIGRLFARVIEPPPRLRLKSMAHTQPGPRRPKRETLAGFRAYQVQYIDRLRQANGIDLAHARVRSPISAWIRIPLGSAFAAVAAHERRHLWQLRRTIGRPGFPT
jgi:hypothetical protein